MSETEEIGSFYGKWITEMEKPELLDVIRFLLKERNGLRDERNKLARHTDWLGYLREAANAGRSGIKGSGAEDRNSRPAPNSGSAP